MGRLPRLFLPRAWEPIQMAENFWGTTIEGEPCHVMIDGKHSLCGTVHATEKAEFFQNDRCCDRCMNLLMAGSGRSGWMKDPMDYPRSTGAFDRWQRRLQSKMNRANSRWACG